jgi:hypothetical protein
MPIILLDWYGRHLKYEGDVRMASYCNLKKRCHMQLKTVCDREIFLGVVSNFKGVTFCNIPF